MSKGPHVVLNQVLRAECPSRVEGATEECVGDGGATGGQESPRTYFGLCASLASLFVHHLSEVSFPHFNSLWLLDLHVGIFFIYES